MDRADIEHRFTFHPATPTTGQAHDDVRKSCGELAERLNSLPEGREKSLAITNLEQCMFWANAAIARS
jgi:hypothetical protein